jgi:hypothetical protein
MSRVSRVTAFARKKPVEIAAASWLDRQSPNTKSYGFSEEKTKSEDFETQTAQAHAGKPPQEAFALQSVAVLIR